MPDRWNAAIEAAAKILRKMSDDAWGKYKRGNRLELGKLRDQLEAAQARIAEKAIAEESPFADIGTPWHETRQALARRVALIAVEEERERCAKVCDSLSETHMFAPGIAAGMKKSAAAIREGR